MRQKILLSVMVALISVPAFATEPERPMPKTAVVPHPEKKAHYDNMLTRTFPEDGQAISQKMGYTSERIAEDTDAAASNLEDDGTRIADNFRDAFHRTTDRVQKWWFTRYAKPAPKAVKSSYCYRALQDIVCYREPVPGWEYRMVGYQGTHAAPPPLTQSKPAVVQVPKATQEVQNRVAKADPVFKAIPKEEKHDPLPPEAQVEPDAALETLPDPALAPQL